MSAMALIFSSHRILAWVHAKGSDDAMQLAEVSGILMIGSLTLVVMIIQLALAYQ